MNEEDLYYIEQRKEVTPKKLLEFLLDRMKQYHNAENIDCELAIADVVIEGYSLGMWDIKNIKDERIRVVVLLRLRKRLRYLGGVGNGKDCS